MTLLEPVVLLDVVEVITSDDQGPVHLSGDDDAPIINATDSVSMYNY